VYAFVELMRDPLSARRAATDPAPADPPVAARRRARVGAGWRGPAMTASAPVIARDYVDNPGH
jgi:hypothetical protein